YFTPLAGVLFTFPSRYWFTIGRKRVFSLAGWSRQIQTGFLVPRLTQDPTRAVELSSTGLSPSLARLSSQVRLAARLHDVVLQPPASLAGHRVWAVPRSLAATSGITGLFSLPPGTEMVHFPGFASPPYGFRWR